MEKVICVTPSTRLCQLVPHHHELPLHFGLGTDMHIIDNGRDIDIDRIFYFLLFANRQI
jgi:hypothetical protein